MLSRCFVLTVIAATLPLVDAASFLASRQRWGSREVSAQMVQDMLQFQLSHNDDALVAMQQELLPTFAALPKTENGRLDPAAARYALHRYFVHKYGWYVRGLDPKGDTWDSTRSATVTKDRLPQHVQSLFHQDNGLDLKGLSVFGSVLSKIMEDEVVAGLEDIFDALGLDKHDISDTDFDMVVRGYLARVVLGGDETLTGKTDVLDVIDEVRVIYRDWPNTDLWGMDTIRSFEWVERHVRNPFVKPVRTFDHVVRNIRGMMHKFNELNHPECAVVKRELMEKEVDGSGRIHLYDFYSDHKRKRESVDFLRNTGVLDESDPQRPKLLIANFIISSSSCLVDASYYSSCCPNECEALMGVLERKLAAPEATPGRLVDIVSHLASDSVPAPRNLTYSIVDKLQAIADRHGGQVPLHGRLFSQWMHHAYPRECPFPQISGNFKPLTQEEFMERHSVDEVFVQPSEIAKQREEWKVALEEKAAVGVEVPWDTVEELVAQHRRLPQKRSSGGWRAFFAVVAFGSMVLPLVRSSSKVMCGHAEEEFKAQLV